MKNMKKAIFLAASFGVVGLSQPVAAQTKDGAAALALLAASGGLGYVAKKAYQKMQLAQTETEKGRAQRRFILAVLGALAAGAGTAYVGHTYFTDSSEEPRPDVPRAQVVSAAPQASASAGGSQAATTRKPRRSAGDRGERQKRRSAKPLASPVALAAAHAPDASGDGLASPRDANLRAENLGGEVLVDEVAAPAQAPRSVAVVSETPGAAAASARPAGTQSGIRPPFGLRHQVSLPIGNGRSVLLALTGDLYMGMADPDQLGDAYWECLQFNWNKVPGVPRGLAESYLRYPLILRYARGEGDSLWIGLGADGGMHGCRAQIGDVEIPNSQLLILLQGSLEPMLAPSHVSAEVQKELFKRDLLHRLTNAQDMSVISQILDDTRATEEALQNFYYDRGVHVSLIGILIQKWPDERAETLAAIVECLQERFSRFDWANDGVLHSSPLSLAIDQNKPAIAQALMGIRHDGRTPARIALPGGLTALHYAIYRAAPEMLTALFSEQQFVERKSARLGVQRLKEAINVSNAQGLTPLMLAMQMQDFGYARVLLESGAALVNAQDQDICAYAATVSTKAMFDALCAHERVARELRDNIQWRPSNGQRGFVPTYGRQQFKSWRGERIEIIYDVAAGVMDTRSMQRLHRVNSAGRARVAQEPLLRDYPLVVFFSDNSLGMHYWMCVDARGRVTLRYAHEGLAEVSGGEEPGLNVPHLHVIQH